MTVIEQPCETTVVPVTRRDVLHRAADLIEEFGHCKEHFAVDANSYFTDVCAGNAAAFCMAGALGRALADFGELRDGHMAENAGMALLWQLPGFASGDNRTKWNDAPGRTKAEVVARLRQAAEAA